MSKKNPITEDLNSITVIDSYRWLEDADDPDVQNWIDEQNQQVDIDLKDDIFDAFSADLADSFNTANFSTPLAVGGRYFYMERQPDQAQWVLYYKDGLDGDPVVIFDPNGKKEDNAVNIDYWHVSHNGRKIAYGVSQDGDEVATLFIHDLDTGKNLKDEIPRCRHSSLEWLSDDSGFFYTRYPDPDTVPEGEKHLHEKLYFHRIGDDPDQDKLIFGEDRPKDDMIGINLSPDDTYLAIWAAQDWTENDVFIYNTETEQMRKLVAGDGFYCGICFLSDQVLMYTTYDASNSRILTNTYDELFNPIADWDEFVPEREYPLLGYWVTQDKIITNHLVDAYSEVKVRNYQGEIIDEIPLPEYSSMIGARTRRDEQEFFYSFNSFVEPRTTHRFNPADKSYAEYRQEESPIDPADYTVTQEWCQSQDGTQVPMFRVHKNNLDLDDTNPTILNGYGAHGVSRTPNFSHGLVPWLEKGGIFALVNVRGGGEFGKSWQEAGAKLNKPNTIADFIAAAEHLVERGYTSPDHLGSLGGSNGGPLVAAAALQRPDLFGAVCAKVPVLDMARFHKFGMASRWVHEFGDPDDPDDLREILKWSPYHNVEAGKMYPSFLFMTADKDTRVDPLHARKMAALLQEESPETSVYLFTQNNAGHGGGKPIGKIIEDQAVLLSYFTRELGMNI